MIPPQLDAWHDAVRDEIAQCHKDLLYIFRHTGFGYAETAMKRVQAQQEQLEAKWHELSERTGRDEKEAAKART